MNSKHRGVFYGWWVVAAAAVGLFLGPPITVLSFSVFLKPLMHGFHAGRAAISLGFTLQLIVGAITVPFAGWLIDRYGARKVILPAVAMFGTILLSAEVLSARIWQFYCFNAALGLFAGGIGPVPYSDVISRWFDRRRGLALGLMMFGIGSGAMIMPFIAEQLIARFGWRAVYAILGSVVLLVSLPVVGAFLKETPQDLDLLPDGAPPEHGATDDCVLGTRAHDAWRSPTFWLMLCAFFLVSASAQGCIVHLAAMLADLRPHMRALLALANIESSQVPPRSGRGATFFGDNHRLNERMKWLRLLRQAPFQPVLKSIGENSPLFDIVTVCQPERK